MKKILIILVALVAMGCSDKNDEPELNKLIIKRNFHLLSCNNDYKVSFDITGGEGELRVVLPKKYYLLTEYESLQNNITPYDNDLLDIKIVDNRVNIEFRDENKIEWWDRSSCIVYFMIADSKGQKAMFGLWAPVLVLIEGDPLEGAYHLIDNPDYWQNYYE